MPSFEQDHFHLLELSAIFEPQSSYHYDCTYSSFESILEQNNWDQDIDRPIPSEAINCTPKNWYTQYWFNCATQQLSADLDCQNKGRPEMTDWRRRPEMTDQRQHVRR